jgi:hypothetical protein
VAGGWRSVEPLNPSPATRRQQNMEKLMGSLKSTSYGELMGFLLHQRERFDSEELFREFALSEVRQFITDLRSLGIELTMRPNYGGQPVSHHSVTAKLTRPS